MIALNFLIRDSSISVDLILVPIPTEICPLGGAAGAAFATDVCHIIAFSIVFYVLRKTVKFKFDFYKMIIKPLIACLMMSIISYGLYKLLVNNIGGQYFNFGMNLEVAYHDNLDDAKWIMNNREKIFSLILRQNALIFFL